tara:strand:- start:122 stop:391 length:270 start_codon:yes stop_codon:yes gene_type:complete
MAVTWTKLETFTGSRTSTAPDPDNLDETIEVTTPCRDIYVRFTDGTVTHERYVNVCYDSDGNYDEEATDERINQHASSVENKIAVGVIS